MVRRMCASQGCARHAVFRNKRGRLTAALDHELCRQCYAALRDRLRAEAMDPMNGATDDLALD
jgi:hypothetical protein